jgi:DNA-binding LytR/AlgR family response regulator
MSLTTSFSLFFVLGLALLCGIAFWRSRGRVSASVISPSAAEKSGAKNLLPAEKNGNRLQIADSEIFSVRANGRYTSLFNGRSDFFCPLSITEVETILPKQFFFRCHRSYIVNLAHVRSVKKVAEAGVVELDSPLRRAAPITRGRVAALREALEAFRSSAKPEEDLRIDTARPASGGAGMAGP